MTSSAAGYREIEHTADWELEVWAPDLPELLRQAALGMYALAGVILQDGPRTSRVIELQAEDRESLLVGFLSELLYLEETEQLAFDHLKVRIEGMRLVADAVSAPVAQLVKEIKAVTYHSLTIRETADGLKVNIVFDV